MGLCKVISYNMNGLHSPIKRKKIFNQLRQLQCQLAFLQKTHLSDREHEKLKKSWADRALYSSHKSGKRRGVCILIHKGLNFTSTTVHKDTEGRFVLVNGIIDSLEVSLTNPYAPNEDDPDFINKIFIVILQHSKGILLLGGDFNCVISQYMDRQPFPRSSRPKMSKMLVGQLNETGLVVMWRQKVPNMKDFTFFSTRHSSCSRIDYLFTPISELHRVTDIKILPITISDHAPLMMSWDLGFRPINGAMETNMFMN